MKTYLVVTVTCPDRPGIVERITEVTGAHGANWEDSRMARLGGDFAGILMISVDSVRAGELAEALRSLADEQMTVAVKTTEISSPPPAGDALYDLRLRGADHEGIVHHVAAYLAAQGINVEDMETEVVHAPITASPLFHMEARIRVPARIQEGELQANLNDIGDREGVDIEIQVSAED
jgi:glycine cleavage system regulatory protein